MRSRMHFNPFAFYLICLNELLNACECAVRLHGSPQGPLTGFLWPDTDPKVAHHDGWPTLGRRHQTTIQSLAGWLSESWCRTLEQAAGHGNSRAHHSERPSPKATMQVPFWYRFGRPSPRAEPWGTTELPETLPQASSSTPVSPPFLI